MTENLSLLAKAIKERSVILFVGAGVSAVLGVPTWKKLIDHIGQELGYDPDIFTAGGASYLTLAEYYKCVKGSIGPLRSWMDKNWNAPDGVLLSSPVHNSIVSLDFPIIYTTNYDRNLENAFRVLGRECVSIVDVQHLPRAHAARNQIVKFHGDFDDDNSIVLTETDYFNRLSFETPLDIKLRADSLAKTVLFVGYSLTDINVRLLLYKLWRLWEQSGHEKARPQSYVFLQRPDAVQEAVLEKWGVVALTEDVDDPNEALPTFLRKLETEIGRMSD